MTSDPPSPAASDASASSSGSSVTLPEALAHGREKRATAGNKLRALLDAEFQEDELFQEDEHDEEFESEKSEGEEDYLSSSSSDEEEEKQADEEEGERALIAEQKADAKRSREQKRKAAEQLSKPPPAKRVVVARKENMGPATIVSKAASTISSISNRRISFDPGLLSARRSSRALTVQTTNEVHERIISAAARRASQPIVQKRERTPPLTQEERLAQAILTEEENKMSLKRIVEAEEERARKRKEKLEALRRRLFKEPVLRFVSRRVSLIEEIPDEPEEEIEVIEVKSMENTKEIVKEEERDAQEVDGVRVTAEDGPAKVADETSVPGNADSGLGEAPSNTDVMKIDPPDLQKDKSTEVEDTKTSSTEPEETHPDAVRPVDSLSEKMDVDNTVSPPTEAETSASKIADEMPLTEEHPPPETSQDITSDTKAVTSPSIEQDGEHKTSSPSPQSKVLQPHTPPPYHEANVTSNTISYIPLPGILLSTAQETFFPDILLIPTAKPKPTSRCPITGLPARYRDPLSGVGYYDIHAFKILREVSRKGSRYVWCTDGGWFVGETGWGGRPAKGVPDGWNV
jgi:vacuolar protein sorting-associated protein 72